jgi:hypothetical protein
MLVITNGDAACGWLRQGGIDDDLLPWRDVLHDGPVPADLSLAELAAVRAEFLSGCGWGSIVEVLELLRRRDRVLASFGEHDEVVLWFEHDLYDQLQLLQVLDWFARRETGRTRLSLICRDRFVTDIPRDDLRGELERRRPVTAGQLAFAAEAWAAFRSRSPERQHEFAKGGTPELPFVGPALQRLLEELPHARSGLARSERQILEAVARGTGGPVELFRATQRLEQPRYLGDAPFFQYIARLANDSCPLLRSSDGAGFDPTAFDCRQEPPPVTVALTDAGRDVLDGRLDWMAVNAIERWLGGVHLRGPRTWRWDDTSRSVVRN